MSIEFLKNSLFFSACNMHSDETFFYHSITRRRISKYVKYIGDTKKRAAQSISFVIDMECRDISPQCSITYNLPYWCRVSEFIREGCQNSCGECGRGTPLKNIIYPLVGIYGYKQEL